MNLLIYFETLNLLNSIKLYGHKKLHHVTDPYFNLKWFNMIHLEHQMLHMIGSITSELFLTH